MAFFLKLDMVAAVMHGTAIECGDRPNLPAPNRIAAVRCARHPSRGRLQRQPTRAPLVWLASALLALTTGACTPVGEVNKRSAQEGEDADAGELNPHASDNAASSSTREQVPAGGRAGDRAGSNARAGAGGREIQVSAGGGTAGKPAAQSSGGRAAGSSGAGSTTGAGASGSAGTGAAGAAAIGGWYCMQIGPSCTCVESGQVSSDDCTQPKPTCCFTLVRFGSNACTCWPQGSEECRTQTTEVPDAKPTPHCPP